ncbi:MAG TPA: endonuclease/exonuclease/phosphatase family protein [Nocardioidaceae bacterium]|nr:endonuclease/exonuclease/phosphatase family protein [Nocardioidaceae bacterium]
MRLATFNIKHGAPAKDYPGDADAAAAACAALDADVLALQEVDDRVPRSGLADLATAVARVTGTSVIFAPTIRIRGGRYGNALLARGEVEYSEVVRLKGARWLQGRRGGGRILPIWREPRNAILATVLVQGHLLSVAATHLATQHDVSKKQLAQTAAKLQAMPEPWILMGDLNRTTEDVLSEPLLGSMELVDGPPTFPSWNATKRIDHVATRGLSVRPDGVRAVRSPDVSDHLALVVDVDVPR